MKFSIFDIYLSGLNSKRPKPPFLGAVLDTGAQRSVIALQQAIPYYEENPVDFKLAKAAAKFTFADSICGSLGVIYAVVPTPGGP